MQNTAEQNYRGLVTFYDTRPGNEMDLFYNGPEITHGAFQVLATVNILSVGQINTTHRKSSH